MSVTNKTGKTIFVKNSDSGENNMSLVLGAISLGLTAAATAYNAYQQHKTNKQNKSYNEFNQNMTQQQFDYQKYLNENQYQLQAADQRKAGINPIAQSGATLNTFSGSASTSSLQAPQIDTSALNSITQSAIEGAMQQKLQKRAFDQQKVLSDMDTSTKIKLQENELQHAKEIEEMRISADLEKTYAEIGAENYRHMTESGDTAATIEANKDIQNIINQHQDKLSKRSIDSAEKIAANNVKLQRELSNLDRESREKIQRSINVISMYATKKQYDSAIAQINELQRHNLAQETEGHNTWNEQLNYLKDVLEETKRHNKSMEDAALSGAIVQSIGQAVGGIGGAVTPWGAIK